MATYQRLWKNRREVIDQLFDAWKAASDNVEREYHAAVRIQSWFRGERVRAYLHYLHECATLIQKCYRGHLGRKLYRRRLRRDSRNSMKSTIAPWLSEFRIEKTFLTLVPGITLFDKMDNTH